MRTHLSTTKHKQTSFYIGIVIMVVLIATLCFVFSTYTGNDRVKVPPESAQAAEITHEDDVPVPELPVRLVIPAIEVDAFVQYVGLDDTGNGEMAVPSNFTDVGWYKHGVRPGMQGSAVIAGHLNGKHIPEAVFYNLHKLEVGDEVIIMSAERIEDVFRVVHVQSYDFDAATEEVFVSMDGTARLNLITCGGNWLNEAEIYDTRTVVFTERMTNVE